MTYPPPPYGYYPPSPPYGWGPPPAPVPGGRLAGMWQRLGGLVLDGLILSVPGWLLLLVAGSGFTVACVDQSCSFSYDLGRLIGVELLGLAINIAYYGVLVGLRGQTVGHMAVGVRVVDVNTGLPIGFWRALVRVLVLVITGALCTLGYWSPFFDSLRRQGWHDMAARSVVIPAAPSAPWHG